jgi:hypothetical protein
MSITRAQLEARLAELKVQLEQVRQQFSALTGAIADIEYWLGEVSKEEASSASKE